MLEIERCKRTDGKKWRCRLPVVEGKSYCHSHIHRQKKKQKITRKTTQEIEEGEEEECNEIETGSDCIIVKDLKFGTMEIKQPFPVISLPKRAIRSKNVQPNPTPLLKRLPSIKENVKAAAKKITKKCHWCNVSSYRALVKYSTCKKHLFCQECIDKRFHCKMAILRKCPVCQGETKEKSKEVETQELVLCDIEEEKEMVVYSHENTIDKSQQLYMIRELLLVMEKMNLEKMIELDTEAKHKGISQDQLQVPVAMYPQKKECSFCKACIADLHRSCSYCSYILCIHCCQEFRDGYLHSGLEDTKNMRRVRSKWRNISWRFHVDGRIICPSKKVGGCGVGLLNLISFSPFYFTKDLEASGKEIVCKYQFTEHFGLLESSPCLLCHRNEVGVEKLGNLKKNVEHFMEHWRKGQPLIISDVLQSQPELNWDFGYVFCEYLKRNAGTSNSASDWCEVQFFRKQIFSRGKTYANVWDEFLKFKLILSLGSFEDYFPRHYNAVMQSLPVHEYMNPFMGSLNLAAYSPHQIQTPNLGSHLEISYGRPQDLMEPDFLQKLGCHAYDVINVLAHASQRPVPERKLNEIKILTQEYSSLDRMKSSTNGRKGNELEGTYASTSRVDGTCTSDVVLTSDDSSTDESDDEDISQIVNTCGARWDIFRREDVPKLAEFLKKYADKLRRCYGSPEKVVHPLFDEICFLGNDHKMRLKKEFNVEACSFVQNVGEAVIIPAGCPYQIQKIKSCVNVVMKFISPESASECIKVCDELRLLPVNHKAKKKMLQVERMVINRMQTAVEEIRKVLPTEWNMGRLTVSRVGLNF